MDFQSSMLNAQFASEWADIDISILVENEDQRIVYHLSNEELASQPASEYQWVIEGTDLNS